MRRRLLLAAAAVTTVAIGLAGALTAQLGGHGQRRATTAPAARGHLRRVTPPPRETPGIAPRRGTAAVPILMYHVIAPPPPGARYPGLYVPRAEFAAQMAALHRAGFAAITLDQMRGSWRRGARLPHGRPIVISFDNGYRSQYTAALPVLRKLGWAADENLQLTGLPVSQGGLSGRQVRGLLAAGWEIDTQGFSHADLPSLDPAELRYQVSVARAALRRRFHVVADWFCYPSGLYDPRVMTAVQAAGYVGATTVVPGWARRSDDPYRLPRLRVLRGTSPAALLTLIAAAHADPAPPPTYP